MKDDEKNTMKNMSLFSSDTKKPKKPILLLNDRIWSKTAFLVLNAHKSAICKKKFFGRAAETIIFTTT